MKKRNTLYLLSLMLLMGACRNNSEPKEVLRPLMSVSTEDTALVTGVFRHTYGDKYAKTIYYIRRHDDTERKMSYQKNDPEKDPNDIAKRVEFGHTIIISNDGTLVDDLTIVSKIHQFTGKKLR